ncbi:hypothetical protein QNJ28_00555 [Macrococcus caseolyticus]|uniref:hypothetical protein n=1 Tax=Macrococcoides caseolyticum TaxID=69966 RepID=UPI0024BD0A77|nr:hypothetical protein [Macrococcus caseolyticus]MDJ1108576.1 hypothetical protein [Macrococcus caseolyticus]
MNETIATAIKYQKEAYNRHIEELFQIVEEKIILCSKRGMKTTLITEHDFCNADATYLRSVYANNIDRFATELAEHLEINEDLIKKVYSRRVTKERKVIGIYINWGEANDK